MRTSNYFLAKWKFRRNVIFIVLAAVGALLPSHFVFSQEEIKQDSASVNASFLFSYRKQSSILSTNYRDNKVELKSMDLFIRSKLNKIHSGKAHLSIVAYIYPTDLKNPYIINKSSVQANVIRSYIKQHHSLDSQYSTFMFDTAHSVNDLVKVEYVEEPIQASYNKAIYYVLESTDDVIAHSVNRYSPIPILNNKVLLDSAVGEVPIVPLQSNKELEQIEQVLRQNTPIDQSLTDAAEVVHSISIINSAPKDSEVQRTPIEVQSCKLYKTIKRPILAIKSNVLYWAGVTTDKRYQKATPNVGLEYFFAKRWSVSTSFGYADSQSSMTITSSISSNYKPGVYTDKWKLKAFSIEPRYWVKSNNLFSQFYVGIYGGVGDFDLQPNNMDYGGQGNSGHYKESGFSLGYYLPLTNRVGVEGGARLGYRWLNGRVFNDNLSSFTENNLKVTGVSLSVSYRLGYMKSLKNR